MSSKERLYIAYGSNLNLDQMKHRCPTAEVVGAAKLKNWRLRFRGENHSAVATIEREKGFKVPVLVWQIEPQDELALDRYEGWPHLYRKKTLRVTVNGRRAYAMVYIMNEAQHPYGTPSTGYLTTIRDGYESAYFDTGILYNAVKDCSGAAMNAVVRAQIMAIRDTGETNMLDTRMVQAIANRRGFYELVPFLEAHRREYVRCIFSGNTREG